MVDVDVDKNMVASTSRSYVCDAQSLARFLLIMTLTGANINSMTLVEIKKYMMVGHINFENVLYVHHQHVFIKALFKVTNYFEILFITHTYVHILERNVHHHYILLDVFWGHGDESVSNDINIHHILNFVKKIQVSNVYRTYMLELVVMELYPQKIVINEFCPNGILSKEFCLQDLKSSKISLVRTV